MKRVPLHHQQLQTQTQPQTQTQIDTWRDTAFCDWQQSLQTSTLSQYYYRYNNSESTIDSYHTWRDPSFTDWILKIDNKSYPVHRCFLARGGHSSVYFNIQFNVIYSSQKETDLSQLPAKCKNVVIWEKFLDFFYTCECKQFEINTNEVIPFFWLSQYFQIPALHKLVEHNFQRQVYNPKNALQFYLESIELSQEAPLKRSREVVIKNITIYPVSAFSSLLFDELQHLLIMVAKNINTHNVDDTKNKNTFLTKLILNFITENELENQSVVTKCQFEKLVVDFVKEGDTEDLVNLIKKLNQMGFEMDKLVQLYKKLAQQLDTCEVSLLSNIPMDIFIEIMENTHPNIYKYKYNFIVKFLIDNNINNTTKLSSIQFGKIMNHINKIKKEHLHVFMPFCEAFPTPSIKAMAHTFSELSFQEFSIESFTAVISNNELNITSEDDVFRSIENFIKTKHIQCPQDIEKLWSCCRFAYLSKEYMIKAQEKNYNIPPHLLVKGLAFSKFKTEIIDVDSPLWKMMEDYKKFNENTNICNPRNRVDVILSNVVLVTFQARKSYPCCVLVKTFNFNEQPVESEFDDISIFAPNGSIEVYCIKSESVGTNTIQFVPSMLGLYTVNIKVEHKLIKGCPLSIIVVDPHVCKNENDVMKCIKSKQSFIWNLPKLNLQGRLLGYEEARVIANEIQQNTKLTHLNLKNNSIGCEGAKAIAVALQGNESLQLLDLSGNSIGDVGAASIGSALRLNTTLQTLYLHCNSVGDYGGTSIGSSLKQNSTINFLELQHNDMRVITQDYIRTTWGSRSDNLFI